MRRQGGALLPHQLDLQRLLALDDLSEMVVELDLQVDPSRQELQVRLQHRACHSLHGAHIPRLRLRRLAADGAFHGVRRPRSSAASTSFLPLAFRTARLLQTVATRARPARS